MPIVVGITGKACAGKNQYARRFEELGAYVIDVDHLGHQALEANEEQAKASVSAKFASVIFQILILDVVFSLDSVITAVGMVQQISIMIAAVVASAIVMILTAKSPAASRKAKWPASWLK